MEIKNLLHRTVNAKSGKIFDPAIVLLLFLTILTWFTMLFLITPLSYLGNKNPRQVSDFVNYYTGAKILTDGKIRYLYDTSVQLEYQRTLTKQDLNNIVAFRTPPTTALLYSLLPLEDLTKSFAIAVALNSIFIILTLFLLGKPTKHFLLTIALSATTVSTYMTIFGGQVNGLILLILVCIYTCLKQRFFRAAGVLTSILFLKPSLLIVAPLLFFSIKNITDKISYLKLFMLSLSLIIVLNHFLFGLDFLKSYVTFLFESEGPEFGTNLSNNTNVAGIIYNLSAFLSLKYLPIISMLATLVSTMIIIFLLIKNTKQSLDWKFLLITLFLPLINMHTMQVDLLIHLIPLAILLNKAITRRSWILAVTTILVLILLPWTTYIDLDWLVAIVTGGFSAFILFSKKSPLRDQFDKNNQKVRDTLGDY